MTCVDQTDLLDRFLCTGTLEIDDVPLSSKAWSTVNLIPLWAPTALRGTDIVLPGVQGEAPYPRRIAKAEHSLPMVILGCWDADGDPYADGFVGLQANLAFLTNALVAQPGGPTGTRTAVLTMPDATTRTGEVHVGPLIVNPVPDGILYRATLDLSIPAGALT